MIGFRFWGDIYINPGQTTSKATIAKMIGDDRHVENETSATGVEFSPFQMGDFW